MLFFTSMATKKNKTSRYFRENKNISDHFRSNFWSDPRFNKCCTVFQLFRNTVKNLNWRLQTYYVHIVVYLNPQMGALHVFWWLITNFDMSTSFLDKIKNKERVTMILNNNIKWMHKLKDGLITLALFGEIELIKYGNGLGWCVGMSWARSSDS